MTDYSRCVLLLSGGLDSAALAAWLKPGLALFVDYGQRPGRAEGLAARAVAAHLGIPLQSISLPLGDIGSGILHGDDPAPESPSPEWWPYRNQLLATAGAAVALREKLAAVILGSVKGDADRHIDGSRGFYTQLDAIMSLQEGGIRVVAPALDHTTSELLSLAKADRQLTGWTVSCHRANDPCGACPGCWKRERVLSDYYPTN